MVMLIMSPLDSRHIPLVVEAPFRVVDATFQVVDAPLSVALLPIYYCQSLT